MCRAATSERSVFKQRCTLICYAVTNTSPDVSFFYTSFCHLQTRPEFAVCAELKITALVGFRTRHTRGRHNSIGTIMSEYWVSQAKYYCKVCNCYIADNKPSRLHHENGVKHKEKVEQMLKQKRMDKLHGARSESELKKQLADIEKAAKEAIAVDRTEHDGSFYQVRRAVTANCPTGVGYTLYLV
jgi:hypothetical protein